MGCDIHLYTEKKYNFEGQEVWICADDFNINPYFRREDFETQKYLLHSVYNDRDYDAFATLAGVRNYYDLKVMSPPRGLPADVSDTVKEESEMWGTDGHSHSWFTARELFKFDNENPVHLHSGMIPEGAAQKLDAYGIPASVYCQSSTENSFVFRTWATPGSPIKRLVEAVKKKMKDEFWIFDYYSEREQTEKLLKNSDNFRVVFWFDN